MKTHDSSMRRPVAAILAFFTIATLLWPVAYWLWGLMRRDEDGGPARLTGAIARW